MASKRRGKMQAILAAAAAAAAMAGCAGPHGKAGSAAGQGGGAVRVEEGRDLSDLGKAVRTREDSLVLDLMLGYRMLLLRNPDPANLDAETLRRSREAYDRLEARLRRGGLASRDSGERVFAVSDADRLSLLEVIRSAAQSAGQAARAGDWARARERWREMVQSRAAIAFALEEAQWGLALGEDLASRETPDSIKQRLRAVDESYRSDAGYAEIGRQVKALLEMPTDIRLQRELKKLANRAWEMDKRAGRAPSRPTPDDSPPPEAGKTASDSASPTATAGFELPAAPAPADTGAAAPGSPAADAGAALDSAVAAEADSLAAKGRYVDALKALERGNSASAGFKERKARIGDRYCEEKRRAAAGAFRDYKRAANNDARKALLRKTADELDSCLFWFPELPVTGKVRKNREMVEGEMRELK